MLRRLFLIVAASWLWIYRLVPSPFAAERSIRYV